MPAAVNFATMGTSALGSVGVNTTASGLEPSASAASAVCWATLSALVGMKLNTRNFSPRAAVSAPMRIARATGLPELLVKTAIVCCACATAGRQHQDRDRGGKPGSKAFHVVLPHHFPGL